MINPPKKGDPSYDTFTKVRATVAVIQYSVLPFRGDDNSFSRWFMVCRICAALIAHFMSTFLGSYRQARAWLACVSNFLQT